MLGRPNRTRQIHDETDGKPQVQPVVGAYYADYEPPLLVDLGHVREATLGSSSSGSSDANSQYYWS
jgi:hypothetical protein